MNKLFAAFAACALAVASCSPAFAQSVVRTNNICLEPDPLIQIGEIFAAYVDGAEDYTTKMAEALSDVSAVVMAAAEAGVCFFRPNITLRPVSSISVHTEMPLNETSVFRVLSVSIMNPTDNSERAVVYIGTAEAKDAR